jgi:hypothetical protein
VPTEKFVLGRECVFRVNGFTLESVRDVGVRRTTNEVDATGYGHLCRSSVVIHRTYEVEVEVFDPQDVAVLRSAEFSDTPIEVTTQNGLMPVLAQFTIHEISADESIDDAVVARFTLRQWGH